MTAFFHVQYQIYNNKTTYDITIRRCNTVTGGAGYHDYPQVFNINLKIEQKYPIKYEVLYT